MSGAEAGAAAPALPPPAGSAAPAAPATGPGPSVQYVVDQGGASFTVHLYVIPAGALESSSSGDGVGHFTEKARTLLRDVDGHPELGAYLEAHPFVDALVDREGGTLEDYSECDPARYAEVAGFLALCYRLHLGPMVAAHCPPDTAAAAGGGGDSVPRPATALRKTVRQTGKIRAKLLAADGPPELRGQRAAWCAAMRAALGPDWDYALIPTASEARLEGTSFFRLNDLAAIAPPPPSDASSDASAGAASECSTDPAAAVAGIGIGSSSTQLYALNAKGQLQVSFDPFLGCKPTAAEKREADKDGGAAKSAGTFRDRFAKVLGPVLGGSPARLLYCHGAFGYVLNELFEPSVEYEGKAALLAKVQAGAAIPVGDFHAACAALAAARPDVFETNLLAGFSAALAAAAPGVQLLMAKAKPHKQYGVDPEPSADLQLSWVRAGVFFGFGADDDDDDDAAAADGGGDGGTGGGDAAPALPAASSGDDGGGPCLVVGVTGGIASGKSTLMRFLHDQRGYPTVDADKLGHQCYEQGTGCYRDIVNEFGNAVVASDGSIDRRALGGIVFSAKDRMRALCDITWPHIRRRIVEEVARIKAEALSSAGRLPRFVFVEAAVLVEAGWMDAFDEVWVVAVPEDVACRRLMARNTLSEAEARKRIRAQLTAAARARHASRVLEHREDDGDDDGAAFHARVGTLLAQIVAGTVPVPAARGSGGAGGGRP